MWSAVQHSTVRQDTVLSALFDFRSGLLVLVPCDACVLNVVMFLYCWSSHGPM